MQGSCPIWDGANNGGGSVGFYENQWSTLWLSVCVCVCVTQAGHQSRQV